MQLVIGNVDLLDHPLVFPTDLHSWRHSGRFYKYVLYIIFYLSHIATNEPLRSTNPFSTVISFPQYHCLLALTTCRECHYSVCVFVEQYPTEEDMIEWAKRESEREEKERLARLTQQEQEDLELAIALSKSEFS